MASKRAALGLLLASFTAFAGFACESPREAHVRWLKEHARPANALEALKEMLGDARVVLLGAPDVELLEFLHSHLHFDVLAVEADFYGCTRFQQCVFPAGEELRRWVAANARSAYPIEVVGFDCQPASTAAKQVLLEDLKRLLPNVEPRALEAVKKLIHFEARKNGEERDADREVLVALAKALSAHELEKVVPQAELEMWRQLGPSLLADEEAEWLRQEKSTYTQAFNARDAQMADNLIWWTSRRRTQKVIVLAGNAHIVRAGDPARAAFVPMGEVFTRRFRAPVPVIAYLPLKPGAPEGSMEDLLLGTGLARGFVDLRGAAWAQEGAARVYDLIVFSAESEYKK